MPLIAGLVLAFAGGGAGFFATSSGQLDLLAYLPGASESEPKVSKATAKLSFVPLDPLIVSIRNDTRARQLRFRGQVEVAPGKEKAVTDLMPRITDILNGYLRAIDVAQLEEPAILIRLRAQMLRRVQIITGDGVVKDLLVTEFVLN